MKNLWNKSELRKHLKNALYPFLKNESFKYNARMQGFVRRIDDGEQTVFLPVWDYNPVFEFSITLGIRLDAVQEIVNKFSGTLPQYYDKTYTSLTLLEYFGVQGSSNLGVRYKAHSVQDFLHVLPAITPLIEEHIVPFFRKYSNISALNEGMNPVHFENSSQASDLVNRSSFDSSNQPYRAMSAMAVAYLNRDVRLPQLSTYYLNQTTSLLPQEREKLCRLLEFIS